MVQYSFMSTETMRLVRTDSPGRPPRLSHSSWTMNSLLRTVFFFFFFFLFGGMWGGGGAPVVKSLWQGKNQLSLSQINYDRLKKKTCNYQGGNLIRHAMKTTVTVLLLAISLAHHSSQTVSHNSCYLTWLPYLDTQFACEQTKKHVIHT